ncbi:hypothetical protein HYW20_00730 [Candidatus Woesearchaeota archaeon]|nr:hypothetical protein [Candidatus Woesearchaeota archaeon]
MGAFRISSFILLMLAFANIVNAATIHGTIYDLSLRKAANARVEINTLPKQVMVAQNGSYSFNVPSGFYTIKAQVVQKNTILASVQENITIKQDGNYVLDLILFPDVEEGIEEIDIDVSEDFIGNASGNANYLVLAAFVLIAMSIAAVYYIRKIKPMKKYPEKITEQKKEAEEPKDGDLSQLVKIIKNEGGRTTQKDIRKQIPLSEAKISLMIAELEHRGVIEKIKKGRGNIIILRNK